VSGSREAKLLIGLLLRQSHQRASRALNEALAPLGLTGRHFGVMLLIDRDGVSTQRDLIRQTGSDKAGMVRTVEDLESLGYLERSQSPADKRVSDLTLTDAGRTAFATARGRAAQTANGLLEPFTDAELEVFTSLLVRFVGGLRSDD
jgi:DNA-binding MarR family transcriptional regulator